MSNTLKIPSSDPRKGVRKTRRKSGVSERQVQYLTAVVTKNEEYNATKSPAPSQAASQVHSPSSTASFEDALPEASTEKQTSEKPARTLEQMRETLAKTRKITEKMLEQANITKFERHIKQNGTLETFEPYTLKDHSNEPPKDMSPHAIRTRLTALTERLRESHNKIHPE